MYVYVVPRFTVDPPLIVGVPCFPCVPRGSACFRVFPCFPMYFRVAFPLAQGHGRQGGHALQGNHANLMATGVNPKQVDVNLEFQT
jgi:hypothetical protein